MKTVTFADCNSKKKIGCLIDIPLAAMRGMRKT